ncbi:hypothetical protein BHE74_00049162 [Ensete ventricosum]|nr:hypothetical protein GW17_00037029 [Ensete ventricosum]RWW45029.1 hypothetical protein BHE74_00049162 [Ensete ventricosum]RZR90537.1 hypothetical protein BHM03_00018443 [Ensete ventricosum]
MFTSHTWVKNVHGGDGGVVNGLWRRGHSVVGDGLVEGDDHIGRLRARWEKGVAGDRDVKRKVLVGMCLVTTGVNVALGLGHNRLSNGVFVEIVVLASIGVDQVVVGREAHRLWSLIRHRRVTVQREGSGGDERGREGKGRAFPGL